jgi:hypothetical protein
MKRAAASINAKASEAEKRMEEAAKEVVSDMDRIGKEAFDAGEEIERLKPIGRIHRFIAEGTGEPDDVFPFALDFLKSFASWEKRNPDYETSDIESAIGEVGENWKGSED